MRRRQSTAVQSYLLASVALHAILLLALWWNRLPANVPQVPQELDVYPISQAELEALVPDLPEFGEASKSRNAELKLSPSEIAALPKDSELLPEHHPSPNAETDFKGQIVELADPARAQVAPEDAAYLSGADHRVEKESASRSFKINPEVVAPRWSAESSLAHEESGTAKARRQGKLGLDAGAAGEPDGKRLASLPSESTRPPKASPAAQPEPLPAKSQPSEDSPPRPRETLADHAKEKIAEAGESLAEQLRLSEPLPSSPAMRHLSPELQPRRALEKRLEPTPYRRGALDEELTRLASLPRQARFGSREGGDGGSAELTLQQGELKGAPSNDRLREDPGESTMLNAREFKYFGYMQRVRRQVNFYWSQALDNIGQVREHLNRNEYTTTLNVALDKEGNLKSISLVRSCGVKNFDEATLAAFKTAAPFPPPPGGLVNGAGEAALPSFEFTVTLARGAPRYSGIDPRAHVLFPGITRLH